MKGILMNEVTRVPFHGTEIVTNDDGTQIALKPVCEAIGLDAYAQQKRLKRALHERGCSAGLNPPASSSDRAM